LPANEILSFEEIVDAVSILNQKGIKHVRITGGEPLRRKNLEMLIKMLKGLGGLKEISMTTNGVQLKNKLPQLLGAGLDRINVSLNTFSKDKYYLLTGADVFEEVFQSIKDILAMDLFNLKINTVVLKGVNDDEIEDFAAMTIEKGACVRFIEYFPTSRNPDFKFVPNSLVKEKIERRFGKLFLDKVAGNGPAVNFKIKGARGHVGFINTVSESFCSSCNRLRLTAEGRLYPCLFSQFSVNLKEMLRGGADKKYITRRIEELLSEKGSYTKAKAKEYDFIMSDIGG